MPEAIKAIAAKWIDVLTFLLLTAFALVVGIASERFWNYYISTKVKAEIRLHELEATGCVKGCQCEGRNVPCDCGPTCPQLIDNDSLRK